MRTCTTSSIQVELLLSQSGTTVSVIAQNATDADGYSTALTLAPDTSLAKELKAKSVVDAGNFAGSGPVMSPGFKGYHFGGVYVRPLILENAFHSAVLNGSENGILNGIAQRSPAKISGHRQRPFADSKAW